MIIKTTTVIKPDIANLTMGSNGSIVINMVSFRNTSCQKLQSTSLEDNKQ